jgi:putative zinc finger protein
VDYKTLSCAEFETLLADWIDEALVGPERDSFVRHLESCAACKSLAEDASSAVAFMDRAADVEMPPALVSKILQATNSGWEFKLRGQGISGWINRTFAPVLRPRIVMGAVLTLMSMTMLTRCAPNHTLTQADLDPVRLWASLDDRTHRIWDRAVKSYESMRLVYEVKNQINDWTEQQREEDEAAADAKASKRQLPQSVEQPKSENRK